MKKIFLCVAIVAALGLSSCKTVRHTATVVPVDTEIISNNTADLRVSNEKISYTYYPTKKERRAGNKSVKNAAVRAALKANGNADVLVAPQFVITEKRGIRIVEVEGYPATYVNFRPAVR